MLCAFYLIFCRAVNMCTEVHWHWLAVPTGSKEVHCQDEPNVLILHNNVRCVNVAVYSTEYIWMCTLPVAVLLFTLLTWHLTALSLAERLKKMCRKTARQISVNSSRNKKIQYYVSVGKGCENLSNNEMSCTAIIGSQSLMIPTINKD